MFLLFSLHKFTLLTASGDEGYAGEKTVRYSELFTGLQTALRDAKV